MKCLLSLALIGVFVSCVVAEFCQSDSDCKLEVCAPGFSPDCHHVDHKNVNVRMCTCRNNDDHHCFSDKWCALNQAHRCHEDGKAWHCSTSDNKCRCYCDRRTSRCDDD